MQPDKRHSEDEMKKILMVEALCHWNDYLQKCLAGEGYQVRTIRSPILVHSEIDAFQPDLVLIGLGVQPGQRWHLFHQLKIRYPDLPVLVYHAVNSTVLEDIKCAADEALHDANRKHGAIHGKASPWFEPLQIAV